MRNGIAIFVVTQNFTQDLFYNINYSNNALAMEFYYQIMLSQNLKLTLTNTYIFNFPLYFLISRASPTLIPAAMGP